MPYKLELTVTRSDTGASEEIVSIISDDEWADLKDFVAAAARLAGAGALHGMSVRPRIAWDRETGFQDLSEVPPDDQVAVLCHLLRPFVLQRKERRFFLGICKIIERRLTSETVSHWLGQQKDLFSGKEFRSMVVLQSSDLIINSDEALMLWLNGFEYHGDREKQERLRELHQLLPLRSSIAIFISMLIDKAKAVMAVAEMVEKACKDPDRKAHAPGSGNGDEHEVG